MSTELTVYSRITDPLSFVESFGVAIAQSRMFGCANESQGKVLAMACLAENENPVSIARRYHIIENNLSMKADAMLAELRARGGKHKVITRTADEACVEISYDGQVYQERFTWEDAQQEPYVRSKDGSLKKNWATPRARRQMLWARVISEAVRTVAPEIVAGTYTPEETMDFADEPTITTKTVDVEQLMAETAAKATEPDVVDVVATPVVEAKQPEKCSAEQRKQLKTLFDAVGASDEQIAKALEKRGVKAVRYLTFDQANELIDSLTAKAQAAAATTVGESRLPDDTRAADVTSPVGSTLVDEIKTMLGNDLALMKRIKEFLVANGKQKVSDLSHQDALALKVALETQTIEDFFARELVPFEPDEPPSG